jgi:hypothetical protein
MTLLHTRLWNGLFIDVYEIHTFSLLIFVTVKLRLKALKKLKTIVISILMEYKQQ